MNRRQLSIALDKFGVFVQKILRARYKAQIVRQCAV